MNDHGLERGVVRLVPWSARWAGLYGDEVLRIAPFLAAAGLRVELQHIGSTAVPGLPAKPIVDIAAVKHALAARHPADREAYIEGKTTFVEAALLACRGG